MGSAVRTEDPAEEEGVHGSAGSEMKKEFLVAGGAGNGRRCHRDARKAAGVGRFGDAGDDRVVHSRIGHDPAPADLVICCHVLYGMAEPVPFIEKLNGSARERVFIMLRESELPHPAAAVRRQLLGDAGPRVTRFSDLFMLLMQMGIAPEVTFLRYTSVTRYADLDEGLADVRSLVGDGWDETAGRPMLEELLSREGDELVFDGGTVLSGVAHWQPRKES